MNRTHSKCKATLISIEVVKIFYKVSSHHDDDDGKNYHLYLPQRRNWENQKTNFYLSNEKKKVELY